MQATSQVPAAAGPATRSPTENMRVAVEDVTPQVDGGRFPAKCIVGDALVVEADAFTDGHDTVHCVLQSRPVDGRARPKATAAQWSEVPMVPLGNDRFRAAFVPQVVGRHEFRIQAWAAETPGGGSHGLGRSAATVSQSLPVWADPERARASAWYEMFPRSASPDPKRPGTLRDVEARLPYLRDMGFDVLYLPPIHPIGLSSRKGPNNALRAGPSDPGSPWAIGGPEGGHKAIHPDLGTMADFDRLVAAARRLGIDIALDYALQCSPDHPYVREHPEWFRWRPDGTVAYAENPPKKYEDVVPFHFGTEDREALWAELASIIDFWIGHGVRTFRVDNPHTKPFAFWEWLIARTRAAHPDVLFLSEAFTRPKVMRRLAKLGFTHSYTYFAWRDSKWDLEQYVTELASPAWADVMRPHFWPNTPDILTATLQQGGRPASALRLVLAATLAANYGIYGPPFELAVTRPAEPGKEEYLDSEKYEVRHWDISRPDTLAPLIAKVNAIRRAEPALVLDRSVRFHRTDNPRLLVFSKRTPDRSNVVLVVANLDWSNPQAGWTDLDLGELGVPTNGPFQVEDLLDGAKYTWNGQRNFIRLEPDRYPAHIMRLPAARITASFAADQPSTGLPPGTHGTPAASLAQQSRSETVPLTGRAPARRTAREVAGS